MRFLPFSPLFLALILTWPPSDTVPSRFYNGSNEAIPSQIHKWPPSYTVPSRVYNRSNEVIPSQIHTWPPSDTVPSRFYNGSNEVIPSQIHTWPPSDTVRSQIYYNGSNEAIPSQIYTWRPSRIVPSSLYNGSNEAIASLRHAWHPSDTVQSPLYNGSSKGFQTHAQWANSSTFEDNLSSLNYRSRAKRSHVLKPRAAGYDADEEPPTTTPSQKDKLQSAQQAVADWEKKINETNETLAYKINEASEIDARCKKAKKEWKKQEGLLKDWNEAQKAKSEWEAAKRTATKAEKTFLTASKNLRKANESLEAAQNNLERVKGEPELLKSKQSEFETLSTTSNTLEKELERLEIDIPKKQTALTKAQKTYDDQVSSVESMGCGGKFTKGRCKNPLEVLERLMEARNNANSELISEKESFNTKTEEHGNCTSTMEKLNEEIRDLKASVTFYDDNVKTANGQVTAKLSVLKEVNEEYEKVKKSRDEAVEEKEKKQEAMENCKCTKTAVECEGAKTAAEDAESVYIRQKEMKTIVDKEVTELENKLEDLKSNLKKEQIKLDALKQQGTNDNDGIGKSAIAGIVVFVILLFVGIGVLSVFLIKRLKKNKKEEVIAPSNASSTAQSIVPTEKPQTTMRIADSPKPTDTKSKSNSKSASNSNSNSKQLAPAPTPTPTPVKEHYPQTGPVQPVVKFDKDFKFEKELANVHPKHFRMAKPADVVLCIDILPDGPKEGGPNSITTTVYAGGREKEKMSSRDKSFGEDEITMKGASVEDGKDDDPLKSAVSSGTIKKVTKEDVFNLLKRSGEAFDERDYFPEGHLLAVPAPATLHGDIHGKLADLWRSYTRLNLLYGRPTDTVVFGADVMVFCGDYVDRGEQQLEVIVSLFAMKVLHPDKVILLRGNHETRAVNGHCRNNEISFLGELKERFEPIKGTDLWKRFNKVFEHLPLTCIIGDKVLAMHGCISPSIKSRQDIVDIEKPLVHAAIIIIAMTILWADPIRGTTEPCDNYTRWTSLYVDQATIEAVMKLLGVTSLIRGHQIPELGIVQIGNLFTVFTASNVSAKMNLGASIHIGVNYDFKYLLSYVSSCEVTRRDVEEKIAGAEEKDADVVKYNEKSLKEYYAAVARDAPKAVGAATPKQKTPATSVQK